MNKNKRSVRIIDRPCGSGKTTQMIRLFQSNRRYLVVTPLLSECKRVVRDSKVAFMQPEVIEDDPDISTKKDHLIQLLSNGSNVVTTHAMFDNLADVARDGFLDDYDIIIDEVMSVVDDTYRVKAKSWNEFYLGNGYVTIDPDTKQITPTTKWEADVDLVDDALNKRIYKAAKSGRLYNIEDGINIAVMPDVLLRSGLTLTIYTYKAEGSIMYAYLNRLGLNPIHDKGTNDIENRFIKRARSQVIIKSIPSLEAYKFSHNGQMKTHSCELDMKVPKALASLRKYKLSDVNLSNILITCPKSKWYYKGKEPIIDITGKELTKFRPGPYASNSRMSPCYTNRPRALWVPNTTRGTNDYKHCTHAIYLYDQYLNPNILRWFGGRDVISEDDYALTELIQWLWRTQVRDGKKVIVYIPSERMRNLLLEWLWHGNVPTVEREKVEN